MGPRARQIAALADGETPAREIAARLGVSARYVRKVLQRHDLPRLSVGARRGPANPSYKGGRCVDLDGYVLVAAPTGHPQARRSGQMFEHRLVAEETLGRYLRPEEVVDHIDGLTLHNAPGNLRVFADNSAHLAATLRGRPGWSRRGAQNIGVRSDLGAAYQRVDTYRLRKERGDVRLRAILRAALLLGTDDPCLSGTLHHLETICTLDRPSLERALADVERRFDEDRTR